MISSSLSRRFIASGIILTCMILLHSTALHAAGRDPSKEAADRGVVVAQGDANYENITITEDTTWRKTILIRGGIVVAPQATLRIEPGTIVRFMGSGVMRQAPRLVVMGRIQCNGTSDKPVLLAPNFPESRKGDWGGVLLLSSEKRNQFENCRIEGAETAIEALFSTIAAKGVSISRSSTGLLLRDSTATVSGTAISDCETALESHDSELDLREGTLAGNRSGIVAHRSTLVLASIKIRGSDRHGLLAEECRMKLNSCELAENNIGALLKGGEGQLLMTRFVANRESGLHLTGARIKVFRCLFANNRRDGMRVDDGRGVVWSSAFIGNDGYNLANTGREDVSAVQNWWGTGDEASIAAKLRDSNRDASQGTIKVVPWLSEKPSVLP